MKEHTCDGLGMDFIAKFIQFLFLSRYMKGEEGFCLTSFQTALRFVSRMSS